MIEFSQTNILRLAITWSGNKELNEGIVVPKSTLVTVNDYAHQVLLSTFFKSFEKSEEFFYFFDDEDLSHNAVYQSCMTIFDNPEALPEQAALLTQRLYDYSTSSKITSGEIFMGLFENVELMGEVVPAIGIFKIVHKDSFLKVERTADAFALQVGEGIATGKLALAALIFGVDEAEGYRVMVLDTISKKTDPSVWIQQFLKVKPIEDNFFNTRHYVTLASAFITQKAAPKFGLDKTDKIDLLNRSSYYFKENDNFEVDDFANTLFTDPEQAEAFKEFKEEYTQQSDIQLADQFDISKQAFRKSGKVFKSVIKLDTNFSIYVHGRRDLIERGFDEEKGKTYYKMYFEQEE